MKRAVAVDLLVFYFFLVLTAIFPSLVRGTAFDNAIVWSCVLGFPSVIYLGIRKKKNWKKILVGTAVFGVLFGALLEFWANANSIWVVPHTLFTFRIFGVSTMEALVGYVPMTLLILVFYEHFFDSDTTHHVSPRIWHAIIPVLLVGALVIVRYATHETRLIFGGSYLEMGLVAIIPTVIQSVRSPRLFSKYARLAIALAPVFFVAEIVGLTSGYWIFPGSSYVGVASAFGVTFPLEEIIFWMLLYPATICAYYEEFVDDGR